MDDEFIDRIISKKNLITLEHNQKIIKSMNQDAKTIKSEFLKLAMPAKVNKLKLSSLKDSFSEIEHKNNSLLISIQNKTAVLNRLQSIVASCELNEENLDLLLNADLDAPEGLSQAERAIMYLSCQNIPIRVVHEQEEVSKETIGIFKKKFKLFFISLMHSFPSRGELKIHTQIFDRVSKIESIIKFLKYEGIYADEIKKIYKEEFVKHISVIKKALNKAGKEVLGIFIESIKMIIKSEERFCRDHLSNESLVETIFDEISQIILMSIRDFYEKCPIGVICTDIKIDLSKQSFFNTLAESMTSLISDLKIEFTKTYKNILETQSRTKGVEKCIVDVKMSTDKEFSVKLVEMTERHLLKSTNNNNFEDLLHAMKLLFKLRRETGIALKQKFSVFEKMVILEVHDNYEVRVKRIYETIGEEKDLKELTTKILMDSADEEQLKILKKILKR